MTAAAPIDPHARIGEGEKGRAVEPPAAAAVREHDVEPGKSRSTSSSRIGSAYWFEMSVEGSRVDGTVGVIQIAEPRRVEGLRPDVPRQLQAAETSRTQVDVDHALDPACQPVRTVLACSRNSTRRILPVAVVGYESTKITRRGRLYDGSAARQNSINSSSVTRCPATSRT